MNTKRKYEYWVNAGFYSGLQKLSVLLFGIISTMIIARNFHGKYEMGIWSLFLTIAGLIEVVRHGLIKNAVIKYLNSTEVSEHKYILSAALLLNIMITLFIAIVLIVIVHPLAGVLKAPDLVNVIYIFSIGMLALIPFSHFEWVQNANSEFKGVFYAYFARQIFTLCLILVLVFINKVTVGMLTAVYSGGLFLGAIVSWFFARKFLAHRFTVKKEWANKLWHFGKYVFGTNISNAIFRSTDQFLVSHFLLPGVVALQSISLRVTNLTDLPSQVLGDILFPKSAQAYGDGTVARTKFLYEKSVGAILAFVIPATFLVILFPKVILVILAGRRYMEAAPYLRIIIIAGLFMPFLKQFGTIMDSTGKPGINFFVLTIIALVNLLNCYFLIQAKFLIGAGIALLATHVIGFIITQALLRKYYNINFLNCFKYAFNFYPEIIHLIQTRIPLKWQKA
ncbi:MAG: oligosaccharide flippase family protein [Flavisolibacter sp.]|jgi:lipopolysaccharide exporter